jgi:hypothetical protein
MTGPEVGAPAVSVPLRDRYNAFIARHEIARELGMGALAVVFVASDS